MEKARRDLGWLPSACHKRALAGFTLAELLISLAILGVIATFIIPKIVQNQRNSNYNAIAKEAMATISNAYQAAKLNGTLSPNTLPQDLTQYMNYVAPVPFATVLDYRPNHVLTSFTCANCIKLHNGAVLAPINSSFSAQSATCPPNGLVNYVLDPDGYYSGVPNSLILTLTYEGRIGSRTYSCFGTNNTADDPDWFSF